MDDYTLQQELEALAGNAYNPDLPSQKHAHEPMSATMSRWQKLFHISADEAVDRIMDHRNNLTRTRISDDHWDAIRHEQESHGYDREAYEYELELQKKRAVLPSLLPSTEGDADSGMTYLVELTGLLDSAEKVRVAAQLEKDPEVVSGRSEESGRSVSLCCVDSAAKTAIVLWASTEGRGYEPTILVDPRSLR